MLGKQCKVCGEKFYFVTDGTSKRITFFEWDLEVRKHILDCVNEMVQKSIRGEINA